MATPTFTKSGSKSTTAAQLPKAVFAVEIKSHELLKEAYNRYLANARTAKPVTLKKGEVRGGGKKPWRQKGTGRARTGSIRSPLWRGGGITFGPSGNENHTVKLTKKAKRLAIKQAFTMASQDNKVTVIDSFDVATGKTKDAQALLNKLGATGKTLLVGDKTDKATQQALHNIKQTITVSPGYVSVYTILNADTIIFTKPALAELDKWLGDES